jgi:putative Holliday junction resolvase
MNEEKNQGQLDDEKFEIITVVDSDGNEHDFELFTELTVGDKTYAVLFPLDEEVDEEGEAIILRIDKDEEGNETLVDIEDEDEWNLVVAEWEALIADEEE